ncbi:MAG TPA: ectonucleotide pyrophosphatase/phosphodiesterase [Verrucomicrobiota bacterium]|nr:ectonucleotide pyrophosphatase/phosphodiesterase [Verrucomicrobiota bacterium]HNT14737.1 ectonucleotide pyrophosphatase/phosphodiesterase [Verrucomicrobiota bacterium]
MILGRNSQNPLRWLVILLLTLGLQAVPAAKPPPVHYVFIVSFDQGNPALLKRTDLPTIHQMVTEGAHTWEAYTIVPSITLPSHTSMLTGVGIQKHQVTWNGYEPNQGTVSVPTIFSLAKARGLKTAMFVAKEKFRHLDRPGSVDKFIWPQPEDDARAVAQAFVANFDQIKPNVCFIHFRDPDSVGHRTGAYSPEKIQALKECDQALAMIRDAVKAAGVLDQSVFILTADHGSHDSQNKEGKTVGSHGSTAPEDVTIPWVIWGKGVKKNFTITSAVSTYDTAATALWLLKVPLPESLWGRPIATAFK